MSRAITNPTESQLRIVTRATMILARLLSTTIGKVLVIRWPQKPYAHVFPDIQSATAWGTQADIYAAAYIGGEPISAGRGVGMKAGDASAGDVLADKSGQSMGESQNIRSKKQKAARGYTKNMSAPEIVNHYLSEHPAAAYLTIDALNKKINKAARTKVGRSTVGKVQRMFRADKQQA